MRTSLIIAVAIVLCCGPAFAQATPDTVTSSNVVIRSVGTKSYPAQVDAAGKLEVGQAPPSQFFHTSAFQITGVSGCIAVATPPSGKAMDVQQIRFDVYENPGPGSSQTVAVYADSVCSDLVDLINPATIGQIVTPFVPGLTTQSGLSVTTSGGVAVDVFVDGFYLPTASAPPGPNVTPMHGRLTDERHH